MAAYTQTWLPVVRRRGDIVGLFAIASHTFDGTETSYALAAGSVPVKLFTVPTIPNETKIQSYMGAQFAVAEDSNEAWCSYAEFVPISWVAPGARWSMPVVGGGLTKSDGALIDGLYNGLTASIAAPSWSAPTVTTPATATWEAAVPTLSNTAGIRYFDFNWVSAFQASFPTSEPAFITVSSNPGAGYLKAIVLAGGNQMVGAITQTNVRIVNITQVAPPAGLYAFGFNVNDRHGNITAVTFNLTITDPA
jgi:hypothetical protein